MRLLEIFSERLREECHPYGTLSTSKKPISLGVSDYMRSNKLEELEHVGRQGHPDGASIADNPSVRSTTKAPPNHLPKHPPFHPPKPRKARTRSAKCKTPARMPVILRTKKPPRSRKCPKNLSLGKDYWMTSIGLLGLAVRQKTSAVKK